MKKYIIVVFDNAKKEYYNISLKISIGESEVLNNMLDSNCVDDNIFTERIFQEFRHLFDNRYFAASSERCRKLLPIVNVIEVCM